MRHPKKIHASFQTFGNTNPFPEPPSECNTFSNITDAMSTYKEWARNSGHDYILADGYGGGPASWVDLFDADAWDGVSYGDPYARLEFGRCPMGIKVESF